jgi:hypothetical protein
MSLKSRYLPNHRLWRSDVSINKETTNLEETSSISEMQMDIPMQMPQTRNHSKELHQQLQQSEPTQIGTSQKKYREKEEQ